MADSTKHSDNEEPEATKSLTSVADKFEAWDYARLKHLEMQGIKAERDMRKADVLTPEAIVQFIHQLSPWNLKTTGVAILEAYLSIHTKVTTADNSTVSSQEKPSQNAPESPIKRKGE